VTQLRQKMLEELQRRNYSHRTARTYVRIVRDFAKYFHQPPGKQYRVVVEVALHNRLEPLAGLAHRIVHTLTELLLNLPQLRPHAFANRLAPHGEPP
jgi:hypothetical protein